MSNANTVLFLGNKNYSSWSLRPWLCLRWADIPFDEKVISLAQEGYGRGEIKDVLAVSPNGRVPAVHVDDTVIWDSLAIAEWAAEKAPSLWPADPLKRAQARSATCEMHSGFMDLRDQLPMNIQRRCQASGLREGTQRDINRVLALWDKLCTAHGSEGPWLFGQRSIADAFFAPVATRFRTYGIAVSGPGASYTDAIFSDEAFLEWESTPIDERFSFIDEAFA
ncbi:MAG: glutathione S-transferase family protein [Pseudomonadota bacterium]